MQKRHDKQNIDKGQKESCFLCGPWLQRSIVSHSLNKMFFEFTEKAASKLCLAKIYNILMLFMAPLITVYFFLQLVTFINIEINSVLLDISALCIILLLIIQNFIVYLKQGDRHYLFQKYIMISCLCLVNYCKMSNSLWW